MKQLHELNEIYEATMNTLVFTTRSLGNFYRDER